jgi:hypothetical protein
MNSKVKWFLIEMARLAICVLFCAFLILMFAVFGR